MKFLEVCHAKNPFQPMRSGLVDVFPGRYLSGGNGRPGQGPVRDRFLRSLIRRGQSSPGRTARRRFSELGISQGTRDQHRTIPCRPNRTSGDDRRLEKVWNLCRYGWRGRVQASTQGFAERNGRKRRSMSVSFFTNSDEDGDATLSQIKNREPVVKPNPCNHGSFGILKMVPKGGLELPFDHLTI